MFKRESNIHWLFASFFLGIALFQTVFFFFFFIWLIPYLFPPRGKEPGSPLNPIRFLRLLFQRLVMAYRWSPIGFGLFCFTLLNMIRIQLVNPALGSHKLNWGIAGIWVFAGVDLSRIDPKKIYRWMLYASIPGILYSFYWLAQPAEIEWAMKVGFQDYPRAYGLLSNPVTFAEGMLLLLGWSLARLETNLSQRERRWIWIHSLLVLLILLLSRVRSGLIGFAILCSIHAFRYQLSRRTLQLVLVSGVVIAGIAFSFFGFNWDSLAERLRLLLQGLELFQEHWILGIGTGNYKYYPFPDSAVVGHPHNSWVAAAAEGGVIGLGLFFLLNLTLVQKLWKLRQTGIDWKYHAFIYVFVSFILFGCFDYNYGDSELLLIHALHWSYFIQCLKQNESIPTGNRNIMPSS